MLAPRSFAKARPAISISKKRPIRHRSSQQATRTRSARTKRPAPVLAAERVVGASGYAKARHYGTFCVCPVAMRPCWLLPLRCAGLGSTCQPLACLKWGSPAVWACCLCLA